MRAMVRARVGVDSGAALTLICVSLQQVSHCILPLFCGDRYLVQACSFPSTWVK